MSPPCPLATLLSVLGEAGEAARVLLNSSTRPLGEPQRPAQMERQEDLLEAIAFLGAQAVIEAKRLATPRVNDRLAFQLSAGQLGSLQRTFIAVSAFANQGLNEVNRQAKGLRASALATGADPQAP